MREARTWAVLLFGVGRGRVVVTLATRYQLHAGSSLAGRAPTDNGATMLPSYPMPNALKDPVFSLKAYPVLEPRARDCAGVCAATAGKFRRGRACCAFPSTLSGSGE